ncbi:hypothetical protein SHELI_v1c05740 [Spiroplasma helicoides]|uniref:Uncharacterized protein n=1 Tax=Spiroplasma helicoides TaxID=216938 RepID=A0A1B3SKT2_9MOLU|nr:hypothetical protein [Spiroplasma helicoides]AOG60525.1 hypothetical protein SHELI_v1c05740 [Spiroplasma helicoides]
MFEQYKDMSKEEMKKVKINLENEVLEQNKLEKKLEKKLKKNLFWWYFLPIFGLFVYNSMYYKRRDKTKLGQEYKSLKEKTTMLELEIKYIEARL